MRGKGAESEAAELISARHCAPSASTRAPPAGSAAPLVPQLCGDAPPSTWAPASSAAHSPSRPLDGIDEAPTVPAVFPVGDHAVLVVDEAPTIPAVFPVGDPEPDLAPEGPGPVLVPDVLKPVPDPQCSEPTSPDSESESDPASDPEGPSLSDTLQEQRHEAAMQSLHDRLVLQSRRTADVVCEVVFMDVVFHCCNLDVAYLMEPRRSELRALESVVVGRPAFYVGATQGPVRRWRGDPEPRNGREPMVGHHQKWRRMHVIAARLGPAGAAVETALISRCMGAHGERCKNKAADSRGLSKAEWALNFIYVCVDLRHA